MIGRRVRSFGEIERPGDYFGPVKGYTGDLEACFFLKPNARDEGVPARARSWRTTDRASDPPHELWDVTGAPPLITVSPSIDIERWNPQGVRDGSYWHGWIRDGELVPA